MWRKKADRLIAVACRQAWLGAGNPSKRHKPYGVPGIAQDLIECLDSNDENRAKEIFLSYEGLSLLDKEK